jgi:hypothetical protein
LVCYQEQEDQNTFDVSFGAQLSGVGRLRAHDLNINYYLSLRLGYSMFLAAAIGLATATPGSEKIAVLYVCLIGLGISVP